MIDKEERERVHRDRARSTEAHWQVAEAAAESEEERRSDTAGQPGEDEDEPEGGMLRREPSD